MSDLTAVIQRVLDLDREATPGPWDRGYLYEALRHVERNVDSIEVPDNAPHVRSIEADIDILAEYRTAAPALARALLAEAREERDALRADLAAAEAERDALRALLGEAAERLLDDAALLHRTGMTSESTKHARAADEARQTAARIAAAIGSGS